jgi:hypothetical protein
MNVYNPARYYAETNAPAVAPTAPGAAPGNIPASTLMIFAALILILWVVERGRLGVKGGLSLKA